ncbi:MAG TPA: transporter [Chryseolinea sp.]
MKNFTRRIYYLLFVLTGVGVAQAQTPLDAIMMKQKESCFALTYDYGSFDEYWEGTVLRTNETIAEVTRITVTPMIAIGLHDKLNFYISVPYVKSESGEPNGGLLQGAEGFQDLNLSLKYEILNKELWKGKLAVLASGGYATPITNYLSDYRPYSLGNGTNEWSIRGIVQYKMEMGLYARIAGGHLFRGETEVERDYYYNNGSYYTTWMDVPNAWEYNAAIGMWLLDNKLKLEVNCYGLHSTSGDDIRKYNAAQPTNKVVFDQLGFSGQYFIKPVKGLGVLAYYSQMFNGRNMGKFTNFGAGLTYQFKI